MCEEYFNKINKNKNIKVISRGLIIGGAPAKEHVKISKELLGVDIIKRKPIGLSLQDLTTSDLIIVSANDIPKVIFNHKYLKNKKKIIFWSIKDEQNKNKKNIKQIVLLIKKKVDKLNKKFEKNERRFG